MSPLRRVFCPLSLLVAVYLVAQLTQVIESGYVWVTEEF